MHRGNGRLAWPTLAWLSLLVSAFMVVSFLVTATGTARIVTSMGYDAAVGYALGVVFDLTKGSLLIIVLAFWARRALLFAAIFALVWVCLVAYMTGRRLIPHLATWDEEADPCRTARRRGAAVAVWREGRPQDPGTCARRSPPFDAIRHRARAAYP
jgi:hypothetical protein